MPTEDLDDLEGDDEREPAAPQIGGDSARSKLEEAARATTGNVDETPDDDASDEQTQQTADEVTTTEDAGGATTDVVEQTERQIAAEDAEVARSEWFKGLDPETQTYMLRLRKENRDRRVVLEQYAQYGKPEDLASLQALRDQASDPNQRLQDFLQTGQEMGIPLQYLVGLITGDEKPGAKKPRATEPDGYEFDDETPAPDVRSEIRAAMQEFQLTQSQQATQQRTYDAIDKALRDLGIAGDEVRWPAVLAAAERTLPPGTWDPTLITNAINTAHATLFGNGESAAGDGTEADVLDDYPGRKAARTAKTPSSLKGGRGGGVPTTPDDAGWERKSKEPLKDGFARARSRFREAGEI